MIMEPSRALQLFFRGLVVLVALIVLAITVLTALLPLT